MKNWSLKHRIIIMGLLPGLIVAVALGGYFGIQRFHDLNDLLDQRALAMAKQLAPVCEYGVMTGNVGILQNIATNMLEERDVRAVTIYSQDMEKLAHAGPIMMEDYVSSTDLNHDKLHMMHTSGSVRVRTPIYEQNLVIADQLSEQFFAEVDTTGRLLGFAELELSNANTRLERYQDMVSSISIVLIALFGCFIVSLRISHRFTGPINDILEGLKALVAGKYETRVRVDDSGELSDVSAHINSVATNFQQRLEDTQTNLEERLTDLQVNSDELEIRNHQLAIGKNEAIEASQMKSVFLANVSHELRTPLGGIYSYLKILERSKLTGVQSEHVATMQQQSEDLLRIIDDLLDLSKLEAQKLYLEHIPFHLRDVIEETVIAAAPNAYKKGVALHYTLADDVPLHLLGDGFRVKQVLGNLLSNAVKFTHEGEICVDVTLGNLRPEQAIIQFSVTDSGIGISEEQQKRLFKPFGQADSSTARQFGGTGLGLLISKALVENMNGEIRVKSNTGQGACFQFNIVADLDTESHSALESFPDLSLAILSAPPSIVSNLQQRFEEWQIHLTVFETLTQLETALDQGNVRCQAVLAWTRFANLNEQAVGLLTEMLRPYEVPVLAITDTMQPGHTGQLIRLGAADCLSLPVKTAHLHQFLHRHFGTAQNSCPIPVRRPTLTERLPSEKPIILVVDDNEPNLRVAAMLLEELGLSPLKASSGQEAIDFVRNQPVDLIFMDIQMPGMNGLQASQKIRQLPDKAALPIIALTAHAMADERRLLLREGMNDYQTKPISIEQLAACVQQWTGYRYAPGEPLRNDEPALHRMPAESPETTDTTPRSSVENNSPAADQNSGDDTFSASEALTVANRNLSIAKDMMEMLLGTLNKEIEAIREAWEMEEMTRLQELVHKLHGATKYCGVPVLRKRLDQFESDLKQSNSDGYPQHMRGLLTEVLALQEWVATNDWLQLLEVELDSADQGKREDQTRVITEA